MYFLRTFLRSFACAAAVALHAATVVVTISPTTATVNQGATKTFTATVTGNTNTAMKWTVSSGGGTITTAGVYTAPATAGSYTVTATSKADTTKKATATVTVPTVVITLSPTTATVIQGAKQTFVATVTGASNTGVTWSVTTGGGSLTTAGVYTAPATAGIFTVTATSKADISKKATATVTVPMKITLSPTSATVNQGATKTFTPTVTGSTNKTVIWSVTSGGGSITSAGIYTAPSLPGTYVVTGTTQATPVSPATAKVTVPAIVVSVSPSPASVPVNGTKTFTATVSGASNNAVTWSALIGSITGTGVYTAPATIGTDTITAKSVADPTKSATSTVTVTVGVSVSPTAITMNQGDGTSFSATVNGSVDQSVTWSATAGSIDQWGSYQAPTVAGSQTVTATSVADSSVKATATVTVRSVSMSLSPTTLSIETGSNIRVGPSTSSYDLNARVNGTVNTAVTWSIVSGGGSVVPDSHGSSWSTFYAPFTPGTTVLKATSVADPTKSATATITVTQGMTPVINSFLANPTRIQPGGSSQLTGIFGNGSGVLTPPGVSMSSGVAIPVSPLGSTQYTLTMTGLDTSVISQTTNVVVVGPGAVSTLPNYPSSIIDSDQGVAGSALQLVVTRDGSIIGIGGRTTYQDSDLHLYRFDSTNNVWTPLSVLPGMGQVVRFRAIALPDGAVFILTEYSVTAGSNGVYGTFTSAIYVVDPTTGTILRTKDLSSSYNFAITESFNLLPDGRILVAGGKMLPSGVYSCAYGASCFEAKNWMTYIDPFSLVLTNSPVTLNHARFNHTALTLQDGRILFVGGGTPIVEIFDPVLQTCTDVGTLNSSLAVGVMQADGRVLCLGAGPGQNAFFDPVNSSLTFIPDTSGDPGFSPLLLTSGMVLADLGNADASLWDPVKSVRLGTQNAADSVLFGPISLYPTLLPDGTVLGGSYYHVSRFDSQVALKISPAIAQENARRNVPFTVANPNGASITWSASGGSIDANGNFSAPTNGTYHVTATASDGRTAVATVNVWPAVRVAIDPVQTIKQANGNYYLVPGNVVQLSAHVLNSPDHNLTWTLAAGTTGASITTSGQFVATQEGIYQAIATAEADNNGSATIPIWIWPSNLQPPVITSFTANPTDVGPAGGLVTLTAQATGWGQENGGVGFNVYVQGNPTVWPVHGNQITVALPPVPSNLRNGQWVSTTYTLVAGNPGGSVQSQLAIRTHAETFTIAPTTPTLVPGMSPPFTYNFTYASGTPGVTRQASGGTITANGVYTAPAQAGTYAITATSADNPVITATAYVSVVVPVMTVSPLSTTLNGNQVLLFTSSISPAGPVLWSCTGGTIDASGLYTAPSTPGSYVVTVTSALDPAVSVSSAVTVLTPAVVTLTVSPQQVVALSGGRASLSSSIQVTGSSDTSITWTDSDGNILGKGAAAFYTAPLLPGDYTLTATSNANPSVSASVPVTVSAPTGSTPGLITLPSQATLAPGQRLYIGTNFDVQAPGSLLWNAGGASIQPDAATASAFFTAPTTPGSYVVTASDTQGLNLTSSTYVTVSATAPTAFNVLPSAATLSTGQSMLLEAADTQGHIIPSVQWTVQEPAGGIITSAGQYIAPTAAGTYHVLATNPLNTTQTAMATITVLAQGSGGGGGGGTTPTDDGVTVSPGTVAIQAGIYQSLSAVVAGADDQSVTWTVENAPPTATIDASGTFVANQSGTYRVFAASTANPGLTGSAVIQVDSSVQGISGAPSAQGLYGMTITTLKDGRILIAGGQSAPGGPSLSTSSVAWIYDPTSKSFSPPLNMTMPRAYHTALLLQDGRVLISGGQVGGAQIVPFPSWVENVDVAGFIHNAELFDPATNEFVVLPAPSLQSPVYPATSGRFRGIHDNGSAALLGTGQALLVGGNDIVETGNTGDMRFSKDAQFSDVFDPVSNLFDVSNATSTNPYWGLTPNCFFTHEGVAAIALDDGSVLATGGDIRPVVVDQPDGIIPSPNYTTFYAAVLSEAWSYSVAGGKMQLPPMSVPRSGHTMTKLADGRVLIVGGRTAVNYTLRTRLDRILMLRPTMSLQPLLRFTIQSRRHLRPLEASMRHAMGMRRSLFPMVKS